MSSDEPENQRWYDATLSQAFDSRTDRRREIRRLHNRLELHAHKPFEALVSHDGVYDDRSMCGEREEL